MERRFQEKKKKLKLKRELRRIENEER